MKFVKTDSNQKIIGFYDNIISKAPNGSHEISDKAWKNALKIGANHFEFGEFSIVIEPLTQEQLIAEIRVRYDREIQDICTENLLNDINSARSLATEPKSLLQPIAKKITEWELANQEQFIDLFNAVKAGKFDIESYTFDDNFEHFEHFVFV